MSENMDATSLETDFDLLSSFTNTVAARSYCGGVVSIYITAKPRHTAIDKTNHCQWEIQR